MTRNDLAIAPTRAPATQDGPISDVVPAVAVDARLISRLIAAVEGLSVQMRNVDPELQVFTPAEAAVLFQKTENWVKEAVQDRRIPFTYVGKSPRFTPKHIRWVLESGELMPLSTAA
ncbi:hypothetical protein OG897_13240 [Streptomyces sp. NBC_00237]|uniref:hypothetical protein n=1 Tax=Streptomyces sp. NBC_00237 TaxID=2975687 RepID=UPI00225B59DE|nr:hypothetical protein [Streptomyces sp. NBC_00237]MCX5202407.1 hypothetical protein [Streptomyces sp. NBC_00237]